MSRTRIIYDSNGDVKAEFRNGECVFWRGEQEQRGESAYVQPDIAPFMANTGEFISGRVAWRRHLEKVGGIEMGAADIAAQKRQWDQRKAAHRERLAKAGDKIKQVPVSEGKPISPQQYTRLQSEILNRLHGRPVPERKQLIKMTLDEAKRIYKR